MRHGWGGLSEDKEETVKWYRMAAEQGEAAAQLALGRIYAEDRGVLKDNKRA